MGNSMVIRTGCRLGAVLMLLAACQRVSLPDSASQGSIGFDAGIGLLQENGTKSDLDTRSTFSNGDSFRVFGRRVGEGQVTRILDGAQVTYNQAQDKWSYNPETYWHWVNRTNYYDFLAVYPDPADANQSHRMVDGAGQPGRPEALPAFRRLRPPDGGNATSGCQRGYPLPSRTPHFPAHAMRCEGECEK